MATVRSRGTAAFESPLPWTRINASPSPVSSSDISCTAMRSNIDETGGDKLSVTVNQHGRTTLPTRFRANESLRQRERDASVGMATPEVPTDNSAITGASGPIASIKAAHNRIRAVPKKRKYEEVKATRCVEAQNKSIQSDSDDVPTPPTSYEGLQSERLLNGSPIRYVESISSANMSSEDSDDLRESPNLGENGDALQWQHVARTLLPMLGFLNPRLTSDNPECRQPEKPTGSVGAATTTATATVPKAMLLPTAIRASQLGYSAGHAKSSAQNSKPNDPIVDLSKRLIQTLESQLKDHRSGNYPDENLFVQSFFSVLCRTFVDLCDAKSSLGTDLTNDHHPDVDANAPARKISRVETPTVSLPAGCGNEPRSRKDCFIQQSSERVPSARNGPAGSGEAMPSDTRTDLVQRVFAGQAEPLKNLASANSALTHEQIFVPEAIYPHQTLRSNDQQKTRFAKYSPSRTGHWCATHVTVANYLKNCQLESNIGSKLPMGMSGKKSISELFEGALKDALKVTPRDKSFRANCNLSEEASPHAARSIYPSAEDCMLSLPLPIPIPLSFMRRIENNSPHRVGLLADQRDKHKPAENSMLRETSLSKTCGDRRQEDRHSGWLVQSTRFNEAAASTLNRTDDARRQACNNYCACYRDSSHNSSYTQDTNASDDRQSYRSQQTTCANSHTLSAPDTGSSFRTPTNVSSVNRNMTSTLSLRYSASEYHRQSQDQTNTGHTANHQLSRSMDPRAPGSQEVRGTTHHYPSNVMQQPNGMVHEQRQLQVNPSSERIVGPESRFMAFGNNSAQSLLHLRARLASRTAADQLAPGAPLNLTQNNQQTIQAVNRTIHNRPWADLHAPSPLVPSHSHYPLNAPHNTFAVTPYLV